jgi:hypothetical protein
MMPAALRQHEPLRTLRILAAYMGPPANWSGHLLYAYLFVSFTCAYGGTATVRAIVAIVTAIALGAIAACGWMGYTHTAEMQTLRWQDAEGRMRSRGFLARAAIYLAVLFFIATLFEAAPAFALNSC